MSAHEILKKRVKDLEDEFHEFKESIGQELLDRSADPKNPVSRLDRLEEWRCGAREGFWRRLLHLKPAKHKNILRIGGKDEGP